MDKDDKFFACFFGLVLALICLGAGGCSWHERGEERDILDHEERMAAQGFQQVTVERTVTEIAWQKPAGQ